MKLKKLYLNLSIKYKLLIYFYIIILIISITFGIYSYKISTSQIHERVNTANCDIVKQISNNIATLQKDAVDVSTYISLSRGIQDVLKKDYNTYGMIPENQLQLLNSLDFILNAIVSKDYISGIVLYNNNGYPIYNDFTDGSSGVYDLSALKESGIYKKINAYEGKPYWFSIDIKDNLILQENAKPKIVMARAIKNLYSAKPIGYILLFINKETINNVYVNNIHSKNESFFIIDESHRMISYEGLNIGNKDIRQIEEIAQKNSKSNDYFYYKLNNENVLITYSVIDSIGWRMYYSVPLKNLFDQITSIKYFTLLMIISAIIFTFPLILLISSNFTAPIKKLLKSMRKFEKGNFNEKVFFKYNDEIGMLGEGYNKMVENIKDLVNTTYKLEIKEKEAELSALQAQINPHLLYNTLNIIYYKAQKSNQNEIAELIFLLSQFFRLSLNSGKNMITIGKEKELIYSYLSLQAMRFKERIKFEIKMDESIMDYNIPKLILQPIVENAVIHGISDRTEGGFIEVSGKMVDENYILFTITDNGFGMSEDMVRQLNETNDVDYEDNSNINGYAIRNLIERLKLTYKNNYSIIFSSILGKETKVELRIPYKGIELLQGAL